MVTKLGLYGAPSTDPGTIADKVVSTNFTSSMLIEEFAIWRESYAGATVEIFIEGTTTLAAVYLDMNLSVVADNPQILSSQDDSAGRSFGKFALPVYTRDAYYLQISSETTGVQRPSLTTLRDKVADEALVTTTAGSQARYLNLRFDDFNHVKDHGKFLTSTDPLQSASQNNTSLEAAIGVASAAGGGIVHIPAGTFKYTAFNLPANVRLRGAEQDATVLQSTTGGATITVTGDDAGLEDMTIDGLNLVASSIGIDGKNQDRFRLDRVDVKRFATGIQFKGGDSHRYRDFRINNCSYGARLFGDLDTQNGADGDTLNYLDWVGGEVSDCSVTGLEVSVVDLAVCNNKISQVLFKDNTAQAALVYGAHHTIFDNCFWTGNTTNLEVSDNPDTTLTDREVIDLLVMGGEMVGGTVKLDGLCKNVAFERMVRNGVTFEFNVPTNSILFRDVTETGTNTNSGDSTKKINFNTAEVGRVRGSTSTSDAVTAWKHQLKAGEVMQIVARAVAMQINGEKHSISHRTVGVRCDSADLDYDAQTVNFTVGGYLTGATSGFTAVIVTDADGGTTGTLSLVDLVGTPINNEAITDDLGGAAVVNGSLTFNNAALTGSEAVIYSDGSASYVVGFAVSDREIQVNVTGVTAENVDWNVEVNALSIGG